MTTPKVTVLMSVYNGLTYLAEAIKSIVGQTFQDFEFLIINDGSTEPIESVFQQSPDPRLLVINQENIGLTRSLNKGLLLAQGEFVARMDADDISLPGRLAAQLNAFETDPRLDLVGSFFEVMDERGRPTETKQLITDPVYRLWRLQFHNNYGHGSVMLRKESVLAVGGYDEDLRYAQDFDLWARISKKNNTCIIPSVLYRYRMIQDGPQSSVSHYDTQLRAAIRISNNSLKACNSLLSETDCEEVRALYWKFQRTSVTRRGLSLVPDTLEGFCSRFDIKEDEKTTLVEKVAVDVIAELLGDNALSPQDQNTMIHEFQDWSGSHRAVGSTQTASITN